MAAIFHPSRRLPDGTIEGHVEGGTPAVLPGPEALQSDPYPAPVHVSIVVDGSVLFVSRRVATLVRELFVERFPIVQRGEVDVYAVAREAGVRAKVALDSESQDPAFIQSFVGDGTVLRQIVVDVGDPIIDVLSVDPDPARYACSALAPTEILRIGVHEPSRELALVIPDHDELDQVHFQLAADLVRWSLVVRRATAFESGGWDSPPTASFQPRSRLHDVA
jgi:N utilization substance protein A